MTNRWIAFSIVGCLALLCLWVNMTVGPDIAEDGTDADGSGTDAMPTFFVSISDVFGEHERPPVAFDHDKHTAALEADGCKACHEEQEGGDFRFTFKKTDDETSSNGLMDSFHDDCIACHEKRIANNLDAGPVTCGECHVIRREHVAGVHRPRLPQYYEVLRDTYHKDCTACHSESAEDVPQTVPLDWKSFYITQTEKAEADWPRVAFDHFLHDKHSKVLEGKCEPCHSISEERQKLVDAERREPTGQDWLWDADETDNLADRLAAHGRCINCHLQRTAKGDDAGPIYCGECHDGTERTIEDMAEVTRLACGQKDRILIQLDENARAKAVAFDHKSHEANSRSCQDCHHTTLRPCQDCHTVDGSEEGDGITLAEAYHQVSSTWSCVGCHENEKQKPNCAGCHQAIPGGLVQSACDGCHTGSLDGLDRTTALLAPEELIPEDVDDELEISLIKNEYGPSAMPHLAIVKNLTELSNQSTLATHFHTDPMTICVGCHHLGPMEAKTDIPPCVTCHTTRDQSDGGTPTLLGAYHLKCLGCHQQMDPAEQEMPQDCTGCHKENTTQD